MSDYRDDIHCRIDPEQVPATSTVSGRLQEISVIMTDDHRSTTRRERCWLPPAICTLTPAKRASSRSSCSSSPSRPSTIGAQR